MDWSRGSKFKDGIRIAAGAYLIYLGVRILREGIVGGGMTGRSYVIGLIASLAFLVFGAAVIAYSLKSIAKSNREEKAAENEEAALEEKAAENEGAVVEEKAKPERIADQRRAPEAGKTAGEGGSAAGGVSLFDKANGHIRDENSEETK